MNDTASLNLEDLIRNYGETPSVQRAAQALDLERDLERDAGNQRLAEYLAYLMRDHRRVPVGGWETRERDDLSYLIAFYGLLEIACLIRFVPQPLPEEMQRTALRHLRQESVMRYYTEFYPLLLPDLLRRRLEGEHELHLEPSAQTAAFFMQFLALGKLIDDDEDVETFLWFLDDGKRFDETVDKFVNIDDVRRILRSPEEFMERISRPPARVRGRNPETSGVLTQTTLDQALHGYLKFLHFCQAFDELLQQSGEYPLFQSAMWYHHSYWFRSLNEELSDLIKRTFNYFREVWVPRITHQPSEQEIQADVYEERELARILRGDEPGAEAVSAYNARTETLQSIEESEAAVRRLLSGGYGDPLAEFDSKTSPNTDEVSDEVVAY